MTWDEFRNDWYPEHVACFTGIPAWMAKLEKASDGPATRDVMKRWYGVLRDVELDDAKRASHRMHAGEFDEPKGFDRHPAAIRKACGVSRRNAEANKPRYDADGNRTYACLLCLDDGLVRCWHPATVADAAKTGSVPFPAYSCVLRCTCNAGDQQPQIGQSPRFDSKQALPFSGCVSDRKEQQRLLDWIANREPIRPENFEPDFESQTMAF